VARARDGDPAALAGLAEVGRWLGIGIANMIVVIAPDRIVIGGGIAAAGDLLLDPIRDEIARRVTTTSIEEVRLVTAELGTWAGAIGAAVHGAERADASLAPAESSGGAP
jgi:glucokinase